MPGAKDEALRAGLGGTFSYFRLGKELRKQAILDGKDLPGYEALSEIARGGMGVVYLADDTRLLRSVALT